MLASPGSKDEAAPVNAVKGSGTAQGQRLWAVLLVLDAFCVIVFGGALAAKMYQHWQAPVPPLAPQRKPARHVSASQPAAPGQPAAQPAAKPAEAKAPAPVEKKAPAAVKAAPAPNGMKPPKPSLLHEAPKHEAAQLAGGSGKTQPEKTSAKTAPPASEPSRTKAVPVDFRFKAPKADKVELAGPFIVRGGRKPMIDRGEGNWTITLYLTPNTYRYHFLVDGKKKLDPDNPKQDRGASVVTVP